MTRLHFERVSLTYGREGKQVVGIRNFSLVLEGARWVSLMGPNGCGKTTVLRLASGTSSPDQGQVVCARGDGSPPRIGYVWQDYRASLLPWLSVLDNIAFPLLVQGVPKRVSHAKATVLLNELGGDLSAARRIYELSGGQQQRITVLRSLLAEPDLLLLDEPFSALDEPARWSIAFGTEQHWSRLQSPALMVSHDLDTALLMADEVVLLKAGGEGIGMRLDVSLERPRRPEMLTSAEFVRLRALAIDFLREQGAVRDRMISTPRV